MLKIRDRVLLGTVSGLLASLPMSSSGQGSGVGAG